MTRRTVPALLLLMALVVTCASCSDQGHARSGEARATLTWDGGPGAVAAMCCMPVWEGGGTSWCVAPEEHYPLATDSVFDGVMHTTSEAAGTIRFDGDVAWFESDAGGDPTMLVPAEGSSSMC